MRLLLDTHIFLWAVHQPRKLKEHARRLISKEASEVFVSAVTGAELALKQSIGKIELPKVAEVWVREELEKSGFEALPLSMQAALALRSMPWLHKDPFDRLLVAQALTSDLVLVTRDERFASYPVMTLVG